MLDLYPTFVELCGLPQPYKLEGHSLTPLLRNPKASWDHPALSVVQYQGKLGRSVTNERWHYVEWEGGKQGSMLLDLKNDPRELKNLAADPEAAKTVRQMRELLKQLPE